MSLNQAESTVHGGVVVGQLPVDRQRRAVLGLGLGRLAGLAEQLAEVVVAARQGAAEVGDGGWSSASFWKIASARRYSASASAGLARLASRKPRLRWLVARRCGIGDGGVVVGQFLRIREPRGYSASASACPARPASRTPRLLWRRQAVRKSVTAGLSSASFR